VTPDERFLKMLMIAPCEFPRVAAGEPETPAPAKTEPAESTEVQEGCFVLVDARDLDRVLWESRRNRSALQAASLIAAIMMCIAIVGWVRGL
jgi:hypothetical protein